MAAGSHLAIVPAYNESVTVAAVVTAIRAAQPHFDVLVVDDGSLDRTRQAAESGVTWFAVAYEREARIVREAAPGARIIVVGAADAEAVAVMADEDITPVIVSEEHGLALSRAARAAGVKLRVHLKIDTGMGRFGVPWDEAVQVYQRLSRSIVSACSAWSARTRSWMRSRWRASIASSSPRWRSAARSQP